MDYAVCEMCLSPSQHAFLRLGSAWSDKTMWKPCGERPLAHMKNSSETNLVFLGFVGRGHVGQILNDLLGVFGLSGSRLAAEHMQTHREVERIHTSLMIKS